jgi:hypothetical protein
MRGWSLVIRLSLGLALGSACGDGAGPSGRGFSVGGIMLAFDGSETEAFGFHVSDLGEFADSLPVPDSLATVALYVEVRLAIPPGHRGSVSIAGFARNRFGTRREARLRNSPASIYGFDPLQSVRTLDAPRGVSYTTIADSAFIVTRSLLDLSPVGPIALPGPGHSVDLTVGGDSLVVTLHTRVAVLGEGDANAPLRLYDAATDVSALRHGPRRRPGAAGGCDV